MHGGEPCPLARVQPTDLIRFLPEIILTVMGTLMMVLDPLLHRRESNAFGHLSMATLVAAIGGAVYAYTMPARRSAAC
jgi:NADH:ubiquinone oxidoreductase subunit 2 (subunit N)